MTTIKLRISDAQHGALMDHLLPGDGLEAMAVALCGRRPGETAHCLTARTVVSIPYNECRARTPDRVTWSPGGSSRSWKRRPGGTWPSSRSTATPAATGPSPRSMTRRTGTFSSVFGWTDSEHPHASAVMLPGGRMFGRAILPSGDFMPLDSIAVVGDDLRFWGGSEAGVRPAGFTQRHAQLFGAGTTARLRRLAVAVIGCSERGAPSSRCSPGSGWAGSSWSTPTGWREEPQPDPQRHSGGRRAQPAEGRGDGPGDRPDGVRHRGAPVAREPRHPDAVRAVAESDVVFGCMDGVEGRHLLNRLASFYNLPYFDVGVKLEADGQGGIDEVCGAVHYLQPDGSSLLEPRRVYDGGGAGQLFRRTDPCDL